MPKKVYKTTRKYQCPYCDAKYSRTDLITHVEKKHEEMIPENYTSARVVYEAVNKKDHGICMVCKKPVYTWNEKICRYNNLCDDPKCREAVRKTALERHMRVYNKPTLLNDPEHQEKMLAHRKISGTYKHSDGGELGYTAKFEKNALEFMDKVCNIPSKDIQTPGPIFYYELNGQKHFYISDIYYIPANLVIECKDGGDNPNKREMPEYRAKQAAKEEMMTRQGKFNYLRLTNSNMGQFLEALADIKYANLEGDTDSPRFYINEAKRIYNLQSITEGLLKIPVQNQVYYNYDDNSDSRYYWQYALIRKKDKIKYYNAMVIQHQNMVVVIDPDLIMDDGIPFVMLVAKKDSPSEAWHKWISIIGKLSAKIPPEKYFGKHKLQEHLKNGEVKNFSPKGKDMELVYDIANRGLEEYYSMIDNNIFESTLSEEVNAIPPRSATSTWIQPILMGQCSYAIGSDDYDKVIVSDADGNTLKVIDKKKFEESNLGPTGNLGIKYIYVGEDAANRFLHAIIENNMPDALTRIIGHKVRTLDEICLLPGWHFVNENLVKEENRMLRRTIVRENDILTGALKVYDNMEKPIKGAVFMAQTKDGVYIHTPKDYYLASEIYPNAEAIPQNIIDLMADLYERHSNAEEGAL